jgi:hypothetical protein
MPNDRSRRSFVASGSLSSSLWDPSRVASVPIGPQRFEQRIIDHHVCGERTGRAAWEPIGERHEPGIGPPALGDHDLLTRAGALEEAREVGLGLVDVHRLHRRR